MEWYTFQACTPSSVECTLDSNGQDPCCSGNKCQLDQNNTLRCMLQVSQRGRGRILLSGQHVSVWCFPDNMCQFDVVRTTCVNLVLSGEVSVCVVRTSVSLVLSEQHVSVWCCPDMYQLGVIRKASNNKNNHLHLSCAHQSPERSHDTY